MTKYIVAAFALMVLLHVDSHSCADGFSRTDLQILLTGGSVRDLEDLRAWFFTWSYDRRVTSYDPTGTDATANVDDWMRVLGPTVQRKDVETILYNTAPEEFFAAMNGRLGATRYSGNSFISYVLKPEHVHVLSYIMLAKEMERLELSSAWVYNRERHYAIARGLLEKELTQVLPRWLRHRFLYQWLRAYPPAPQVVAALDREIGQTTPTSTIHRWILLSYAAALNVMHRPVEANLALCDVFDHCPSKRMRALQLLNTDTTSIQHTLARASKRKRIALLTMIAMRDPGPRMQDVRRVHRLDRSSRYWLFLATREINKLEDYMSSSYEEDRRTLDLRRVRELESFLASALPTTNTEWNCYIGIMLAQCATLRHDHNTAYKRLMAIKSRPTPVLEHQYQTVLAFHYIETDKIFTAIDAERLATLLISLNHEPAPTADSTSYWVVSSLTQLASGAYAKHGHIALAGLYSSFGRAGRWTLGWEEVMTSTELNQVLAVLRGDTLPNVRRLLKSGNLPSEGYVHGLLSYAYCAEGRFAEAAVSARAAEYGLDDGQEFISDVNNLDPFFPRWVGPRRTIVKRWKASVLYDSLACLERLASLPNAPSRTLLNRAHALYSISYYGSAWYLSRSGRSEDYKYDSDLPYEPSIFMSALSEMGVTATYAGSNKDYYLLERSRRAYQRARDAALTAEERSEAEFMLALCEENRNSFLQESAVRFRDQWPFRKDDHNAFISYYKRFGNTEFAKRSLCPLIESYMRRKESRVKNQEANLESRIKKLIMSQESRS